MTTQDQPPDLDPLLDLETDAPPEFKCPITMSIMRDPVIMPDGQTYERKAIENALKINPISPLTRQPMSMSESKTNYALKSLIDKYIQDHQHEIVDTPEIIDPSNIMQSIPTDENIPITTFSKLDIETFTGLYTENSMLITIKPLTIPGRLPVSIIALIDTSGSMRADASLPTPGTENIFFSRIKLVQYSLKTIVSILGPSDHITLITFSDMAKTELESVILDSDGKKRAMDAIDSIYPSGQTNVWDALDKGIDLAIREKRLIEEYRKSDTDKEVNTSILLFTDGEPNINPPIGIVPSLIEKVENLQCHFSISTFGFGYKIDSELLFEIAEIGNGIYGYCPDISMVGTIFINYLSSLVSLVAPLAFLNVNDKQYKIALYNGAPTNLMISLDDKMRIDTIQINLSLPLTNQTVLIKELRKLEDDQNDLNFFRDQKYRKSLIDIILDTKSNQVDNEASIEKVLKLFEQLKGEENRSQFMKNMMIDLYNDDNKHGQIERAYHKEYFKKWGQNYLFSLLRFHVLEQCGNFKDLSIQLYGNDVFRKARKIGNKIFINLPIPQQEVTRDYQHNFQNSFHHHKHHHHHHHHHRSSRNSVSLINPIGNSPQRPNNSPQRPNNSPQRPNNSPQRPTASPRSHAHSDMPIKRQTSRQMSMRSVSIASIVVCFNGDALIDLWGGSKKKVKYLQKSDKLANGSKIVCLVRCATKNGFSAAVKIGDALFSPYHPVKVNIEGEKKWAFPAEVGKIEKVKIDFWYNMIIDHDNSPVVIGGVETVTLGHNMKNDVCFHPYYGTQKVVDALKKYDQFKNGFLEFKDPPTPKRDPITNMVVECF